MWDMKKKGYVRKCLCDVGYEKKGICEKMFM